MDSKFKNISMTGRLCYLFMCIEQYLTFCYSDKDWTIVSQKCWQWTNTYWNEGCDEYSKIVPCYLLEFDNYKETNERAFEGTLSQKEYHVLRKLYDNITSGDEKEEINQMLLLPIALHHECEGASFAHADKSTLAILLKAESILLRHHIPFPNIQRITFLTVKQKNGWGDFIESEFLSILETIHKKKKSP